MSRLIPPILLCWLALPTSVWAVTIVLQPSKDNTLHQQTNPNAQTSNGQGDIFIGRTNQDGQGPPTISIRRGLLAFDVASQIPSGATITSATLTMRDVMGLNGDHAANLHVALSDWGEGSSFFSGGQGAPAQNNDATWLYRFYDLATPANSVPWTTPGGDFSAAVSGSALITDDLGGGQIFTWNSTPLMIADVQSWLDNPATNFGWLIRGNEAAGQTAKRLNSGEFLANPPLLSIEYTAVPEPSSLTLVVLAALALVAMRFRRR